MMLHGGDTTGFAERWGRPPLDFSASINPLGLAPAVRAAAAAALDRAHEYPDPLARRLRDALAQCTGVDPGQIVLGNGAADILHRLVQAVRPRRGLVTAPAFAEYARALEQTGAEVVWHHLRPEHSFAHDASLLDAVRPGVDMVFVCQPCNPTGQAVPPPILAALADRCAAVGALLCMDESFCAFMDQPDTHSLKARARKDKHIVVVDSFTKLYAMPGLRLGWALGADTMLMARVQSAGQPWPVSSVAQAAGLAALDADEYVQESLRVIRQEKAFVCDGLARLGAEVLGSAANFLFFRWAKPNLTDKLAAQGILIRSCANFPGLGQGYWRIAVRLRADNECLLAAMAALEGE